MLPVIIGLPFLVYLSSVQPGAALVRLVFERGEAVRGSDAVPLERPMVEARLDVPLEIAGWPTALLDVYAPVDPVPGSLPIVLWIHGGGFIANSARDLAGFARVLADEGHVVAALEYTRAPEARYPTPIVQANAALSWLKENAADFGGDASRFFLGGDSAGAQIASQLAAVESDADFAAAVGVQRSLEDGDLRGVILYCGLYDMETVAATRFPALRTFLWAYTGHRDWLSFPRIAELSTTRNLTAAYPPTFLAVGDADPFESQAFELRDALVATGVSVTTQFWSARGLGHEYQFDFRLPEAVETLGNTLAFMREMAR